MRTGTEKAALEAPGTPEHSDPPAVRAGRVLVIEDELHIARLLEHLLRREGYATAVYYDAEAGRAAIDDFQPDALLLDLVLPGMSGFELLRDLRRNPRWASLPVIVLSAQWFDQEDPQWLESGATAQCPKPIAPSKLFRQLRECAVEPAMRRSGAAA